MKIPPVPLEDLNHLSLSVFKPLFSSLPTPELADLQGVYRAQFTGPAWLRRMAPPGLALGGLGGWWGKRFTGEGRGLNLVLRGGELLECLPFHLAQAPSFVDGKPALAVHYDPGSPFPWNLVIDELRWFGERTLLGMTLATPSLLNRLPLPFLLFCHEG